ncbi:MAG: Mor transcription activator family protein [Methylovulum sp.]|nr:Mor transcription activator family protein [Methylovulum sp.]
MDDFKALVFNFGYTRLEIPRCSKLIRLARDIKILQDSRAGLAQSKLALKYQMTARSIRIILPKTEQLDRQPWLNEIQGMVAAIM